MSRVNAFCPLQSLMSHSYPPAAHLSWSFFLGASLKSSAHSLNFDACGGFGWSMSGIWGNILRISPCMSGSNHQKKLGSHQQSYHRSWWLHFQITRAAQGRFWNSIIIINQKHQHETHSLVGKSHIWTRRFPKSDSPTKPSIIHALDIHVEASPKFISIT